MKRLIFLSLLMLSPSTQSAPQDLRGTVKIDGSSTVFPITEAVAEEFNKVFPRVRVTVGVSGTGGGFKKFLSGYTDINDASRPMKPSEKQKAKAKHIKYIKFPVGYDGITVVVNPKNTWATELTVEELRKIWKPQSTVKTWKDIRPEWPNKPIKLYGPGTDSGTFDYFTEAILGKSGRSRSDFTKSEDDNVLVQGVMGDLYAMGYFGYAYYKENKNNLKALAIAPKKGAKAILPSLQSIKEGSYKPLSREIYIYVKESSLKKPAVREFVSFYMKHAKNLVKNVGYVPLTPKKYQAANLKIEAFSAKK
ncbi:MAG: PstS family phosphate ABC transporter substrate-binding protein [Bdellovibrio sp.]|nr:MAG: PstS family phosphate ABC transporter substrate-binding protein [Bdellovibrio sp.]